jgi:putative spermidine/putrescine transport system permease protein
LFDERGLAEITAPAYPGERLVVCRNPDLARERARKREDLLAATERDLAWVARATGRLRRPLRGRAEIGLAVGAVLGALLAWAVSTGPPDGMLRRVVTSASGVLAQFGGVTLAFAFLATVGFEGLVTKYLRDNVGIDLFAGSAWLFDLPGLTLVYTFFQIPLMVIVFLPALDGLRPQWREANASLGGTSWTFWRHVGGPILTPPFLGALLLLFANAFSAYATAAALVSQGSPIVPLQIRGFLTGEVVLGQENLGKALGLGMVIVVSIAMGVNVLLQRRVAKWVRQ